MAGRTGGRAGRENLPDPTEPLTFLDHVVVEWGNGVRIRNARLSAIKSSLRQLKFQRPERLDLAALVRASPQKRADLPPVDCLNDGDAPVPDTVTPLRDRATLCLACCIPERATRG